MMHPDTEIRSSTLKTGHLGVYATAPIPRGTIVYVKDELDVEVTEAQYAHLDPLRQQQIDKYSYIESTGTRVVSWDLAKYVNHSCRPNTMSTGWGPEIAVEDIPRGAEITDEYGLLNMETSMHCFCGSKLCRGQVDTNDPANMGGFWDEQIQAALSFSRSVKQPLWTILSVQQQQELDAYLVGKAPYSSIMTLIRQPQASSRHHYVATSPSR